jgi:deoxyribose-phosphate aldolase
MVIDIGVAKAGRFADVQADIAAVRASVPAPKILKVIIESAALTDAEIVAACEAAVAAGADFVKTSTGFHPAGGATVHAVRLMKQSVGDRAKVKASGGVRSFDDALAMIDAGATRLGVSASAALLGFDLTDKGSSAANLIDTP